MTRALRPGFDAIVGNPPWEMLRGDRGDGETRQAARAAAARLTDFARGSGLYLLQGNGHANLYQLFLERSLALVRAGGRIGLVLPSGLATDTGAAGLRRTLFDRTHIDSLVSLENRDAPFPRAPQPSNPAALGDQGRTHGDTSLPFWHSYVARQSTDYRRAAQTQTP